MQQRPCEPVLTTVLHRAPPPWLPFIFWMTTSCLPCSSALQRLRHRTLGPGPCFLGHWDSGSHQESPSTPPAPDSLHPPTSCHCTQTLLRRNLCASSKNSPLSLPHQLSFPLCSVIPSENNAAISPIPSQKPKQNKKRWIPNPLPATTPLLQWNCLYELSLTPSLALSRGSFHSCEPFLSRSQGTICSPGGQFLALTQHN